MQKNQKTPLSRSLTQPQGTMEYVVEPNDTMTSVAARFHTTPSELARINRRSGHFIFPGQILFVPKSHHTSTLSSDLSATGAGAHHAPPNTPNDSVSKSPSRVITPTSNDSDGAPSASDNNDNPAASSSSPVPGHVERIPPHLSQTISAGSGEVFVSHSSPAAINEQISSSLSSASSHHLLLHTSSEPVHKFAGDSGNNTQSSMPQQSTQAPPINKQSQATTIDPADRECLERFLKINVRYITDGQGVVSGVLLVTPNALMFDSNVSDPLVMEHGPEMYNITVPIELVLKTALYSDIAHMRVKHAPEAVPSVPKPSVYYASDEDTGGIVEENLKNAYAKKKNAFDTIGKVSEEKVEVENKSKSQQQTETDEEFTDALEHHDDDNDDNEASVAETSCKPETIIKPNCDDVPTDFNNKNSNQKAYSDEEPQQGKLNEFLEQSEKSVRQSQMDANSVQESTEDEGVEEDAEGQSCDENIVNRQRRSDFKESVDDDQATSMDQSLDLMTSIDDPELNSFLTPPPSATDPHNQSRKPMLNLAKISLSERHSAPSQANHMDHRSATDPHSGEHKPLKSAVSAEETCSDPSPIRHRISASGENRRGQMLKRLSNPVDTIGNLTKSGISSGINATKSGFNATKTGISKGLNATQTGITSGYQATKSGLTTGLSVTKTGFNKVLSTPKNLMDFSSGLVRDAKGALAPTASKSDMNLQEHLEPRSGSFDEAGGKIQNTKSITSLPYCNMVDTKIEAFENFDKLIPRPAKVCKDTPLYLCIRMGKYKKGNSKRLQRYSPTYSFGKSKYEREYWFSVPKDKAKNLYHFFKKWAPEIYGDVDDLSGCEERGLEPITTDDELDLTDGDGDGISGAVGANNSDVTNVGNVTRRSYLRILSQDKSDSGSLGDDANSTVNDPNKMNASQNRQQFWRRSPLHFLKLVEDHFSTDGLSGEWNVSNSSEEHSFAERYNLEPNNDPIIPELIGPSELLSSDIIQNLSKHLPARAEGYPWTLIYSTSQHGYCLGTLYHEMKRFDSPVLLLIEDANGDKFGALLSHSLRISDHFYGTGETFLFTFHPTFECFPWTGENIFFIKGNIDSIAIGAGEGNFGLWVDGDLYHGSSHPCKTFGNRKLSHEEDFVIKSIECWGFV